MTTEKRSWMLKAKIDGEWVYLCTIASVDAPELCLYVPDGVAPPPFVPFSMVWTEEPYEDGSRAEFISEGGVRDA